MDAPPDSNRLVMTVACLPYPTDTLGGDVPWTIPQPKIRVALAQRCICVELGEQSIYLTIHFGLAYLASQHVSQGHGRKNLTKLAGGGQDVLRVVEKTKPMQSSTKPFYFSLFSRQFLQGGNYDFPTLPQRLFQF